MTAATASRGKEWLALVGFAVLSYGVAALGSLATLDNVRGWYAVAEKPPYSPPNWLFGPVWTVLYGLIAVAGWLVWRRRDRPALVAWGVQLALNLAWTPTFFALQWLWVGLVVIVALDVAVVVTILRFRRVRPVAAWLLVPYLAWILFATALNAGVAALN
ncbi:TspO/MBR family protein [Actinokineospora sp. NBRC 105648]|uniref:TspO/MBR family protein n=1 Tax=Actinokineospora sp. NBRC 105648 TaxID=3032206 RepID=UPI0024A1A2FF|nr:TspO/MBR family protein [Actinokineospora sp. NBRC 105648]GLZ38602.1 tryptophan-rich sensory protein [Actinokineospora sp. NBRC 105648]